MKIEIDVSERSLEEQINEACKAWRYSNGVGDVQEVLRDFAAGKFARAPMPEIVKPKWAARIEIRTYANGFYCIAEDKNGDAYAAGPTKPTEREAILAFNELFGGAS